MDEHLLIETHPLPPFTPANAKLLMLGSFPPPRARWKMEFYYPNFQNDMWRIFGLVFFGNKDYFVEAGGKTFKEKLLRAFLADKGIAISDTAHKVIRLQGNASDKFLQIVEPVDLQGLLAQMPLCRTVMTTGELATDTLLSLMPPDTGKPKIGGFAEAAFSDRHLRLYRLPSSSRAYPLALEKKAEIYGRFFAEIGLLL
ncbi:uracil-DNA glycosylase family protein [Neisseria wadsworthii]|uniref:G/U mismatch-specific DNA glycosylase n=1 Tax=Neisseria wadsworthii 9715 TaxID=1030841 RepID=G4CTW4_9NEIS|nr:uracil-DNA glycosylase family protein [Neisseria wadsworthii]EGZ43885.1 G/U mismatch-specific DNA glycosylase [Neisseria wadsworthii 9715]